ncbi:MAG TPA: hypothetical protein ENK10_09985, partial [Acidobacteria bacterium]|nr:hypothetical protein [Acidobacteriota bacterium]
MAIDRSRLLADAEKAARRGNMKQAADCYRALVEASPNDRTLLQRLGDALARAGESQAACEVLEDLAELYRAEGDQHRSVAVLRRACRLAEDRELLDKLGCWLCEQGLAADARQPLLEAARLHEAAGDPAAALAVWRRLAEGREGDLEALREVLRLGAADGAQALSVRERAALAVDLSRHSALEESIENFVAAAAAGPALIEGGWLEHFMRAFERLGHLPERAETISEPGVAANWVLVRAGTLERLGRRDEARAELVDGLRSAAAWPVSARLAAGRMLIGLEVFDAAAKVLLGLGPSPPGISTHALKDALSELVTRDPGQHAVMERLLAISSAAEPSTGEEGAKRSAPGGGTPTAAAPGADESEPGEQQPALSTTLRAEVLEIESFVAHGMYSRARAALASLAGRAGPHPEVLRLEQAVEAL